MDYQKLNKELHALQKHKYHNENNKETTKHVFYTRLVNLTHVKFSNDQINTLNVGFDYAIEKNPKQFNILIDTENAIRYRHKNT